MTQVTITDMTNKAGAQGHHRDNSMETWRECKHVCMTVGEKCLPKGTEKQRVIGVHFDTCETQLTGTDHVTSPDS